MTNDDFSFEGSMDQDDPVEGAIAGFDSGNADSDVFFVDGEGKLLSCYKPWTGWYRKNRAVWIICKDQDGYRVRKPNGGIDS